MLRRIREEEPPRPSDAARATRATGWPRSPPRAATEPARLTQAGARRARLDRDEGAWRRTGRGGTRRPTAWPATSSATWTTSRWRRARRRRGTGCGKLARRHRAALVVAAAFASLLVAAAAVSTWQAVRATAGRGPRARASGEGRTTDEALKESEAARSQAEAVSTFLVEAFRKPDPAAGRRDGDGGRRCWTRRRRSWTIEFAGSPRHPGLRCSTRWGRRTSAWACTTGRPRPSSGPWPCDARRWAPTTPTRSPAATTSPWPTAPPAA